jgi:hypothetical protein
MQSSNNCHHPGPYIELTLNKEEWLVETTMTNDNDDQLSGTI